VSRGRERTWLRGGSGLALTVMLFAAAWLLDAKAVPLL
jgi:hypothetical protein